MIFHKLTMAVRSVIKNFRLEVKSGDGLSLSTSNISLFANKTGSTEEQNSAALSNLVVSNDNFKNDTIKYKFLLEKAQNIGPIYVEQPNIPNGFVSFLEDDFTQAELNQYLKIGRQINKNPIFGTPKEISNRDYINDEPLTRISFNGEVVETILENNKFYREFRVPGNSGLVTLKNLQKMTPGSYIEIVFKKSASASYVPFMGSKTPFDTNTYTGPVIEYFNKLPDLVVQMTLTNEIEIFTVPNGGDTSFNFYKAISDLTNNIHLSVGILNINSTLQSSYNIRILETQSNFNFTDYPTQNTFTDEFNMQISQDIDVSYKKYKIGLFMNEKEFNKPQADSISVFFNKRSVETKTRVTNIKQLRNTYNPVADSVSSNFELNFYENNFLVGQIQDDFSIIYIDTGISLRKVLCSRGDYLLILRNIEAGFSYYRDEPEIIHIPSGLVESLKIRLTDVEVRLSQKASLPTVISEDVIDDTSIISAIFTVDDFTYTGVQGIRNVSRSMGLINRESIDLEQSGSIRPTFEVRQFVQSLSAFPNFETVIFNINDIFHGTNEPSPFYLTCIPFNIPADINSTLNNKSGYIGILIDWVNEEILIKKRGAVNYQAVHTFSETPRMNVQYFNGSFVINLYDPIDILVDSVQLSLTEVSNLTGYLLDETGLTFLTDISILEEMILISPITLNFKYLNIPASNSFIKVQLAQNVFSIAGNNTLDKFIYVPSGFYNVNFSFSSNHKLILEESTRPNSYIGNNYNNLISRNYIDVPGLITSNIIEANIDETRKLVDIREDNFTFTDLTGFPYDDLFVLSCPFDLNDYSKFFEISGNLSFIANRTVANGNPTGFTRTELLIPIQFNATVYRDNSQGSAVLMKYESTYSTNSNEKVLDNNLDNFSELFDIKLIHAEQLKLLPNINNYITDLELETFNYGWRIMLTPKQTLTSDTTFSRMDFLEKGKSFLIGHINIRAL